MKNYALKIHQSIIKDLRTPEQFQTILFFGAALVMFALCKALIINPVKEEMHIYGLIGSFLIAVYGHDITAEKLPSIMRILLRSISSLFALYLALNHPTYIAENPNYGFSFSQIIFLDYGRYLGIIAAIFAWFRPSWGMVTITFVLFFKGAASQIIGSTISYTDYNPLIEVSCLLIIIFMMWFKALNNKKIAALALFKEHDKAAQKNQLLFLEKATLLAISAHMANYFYSGLKKIKISEAPFDWALDNTTYSLLPNALKLGQLPIAFSAELTDLVFTSIVHLNTLSNMLIFIGQLFAIIAIFRVRWLIWITLFHDLTHIIIFLVSGIFFYKWIVLNIAIVLGLKTIQEKTISPLLIATLMVFMVASPSVFFVAKLGWWDTPALNVERFYAITKDKRAIAIPSNYWGVFSVTAAQQRFIWRKEKGFLPTGTYGITFGNENVQNAKECNYELDLNDNEANIIGETFSSQKGEEIREFVKNYHEWVLRKSAEKKNWNYNFFPHHIFSFPWTHSDFRKLDIKDVVAYRYSIKAFCNVNVKDGHLNSQFLKEGYYDIPIE